MILLPQGFVDFSSYFQESILFLQKYSWLYEAPVTNILTHNFVTKVPKEWIDPLFELSVKELNDVPIGLIKDKWPLSLREFSQDCQRLTLPVLKSAVPHDVDDGWLQLLPRELWRGMSPKKREEVVIMSEFVHYQCKKAGINKVLDLGSGLGYIDRLLLLRGYRVLGIESQVKLTAFASLQKENFFPPNLANNLNYYNMRISLGSVPELKVTISESLLGACREQCKTNCEQKKNENINKYDWDRICCMVEDVSLSGHTEKVCMIGLHACGDLAVTGIKMYTSLPEVSALVLVPCCYHKMALRPNSSTCDTESASEDPADSDGESGEEAFENFPLSETLAGHGVGAKFVCRPFLRLAGQASNSSWQNWSREDHQRHSFNVLSRAVVQLCAQQEGTTFKKCFRRVVKRNSLISEDFPSYVDESLSRCEFLGQNKQPASEKKEKIRQSLLEKWEEHKSKLGLVEVWSCLQMCLEPVAESLVVADRVSFLQESGVDNIDVVKIIDSRVSPRCLAFIASKS